MDVSWVSTSRFAWLPNSGCKIAPGEPARQARCTQTKKPRARARGSPSPTSQSEGVAVLGLTALGLLVTLLADRREGVAVGIAGIAGLAGFAEPLGVIHRIDTDHTPRDHIATSVFIG